MKKLAKNKKIKYLVFGFGQIAKFIEDYFENVFVSHADITIQSEIERDINKYKPEVVINTAAITSLEDCELNKLKAFDVNTLGAYRIWEVCQRYKIFLCHFSSGCIFSSKTPDQIYTEKDQPNPKSYYSWTKVWSENLLGKSEKLLIIRPRVVISSKVDRRNTLAKWLVYSHFITDQNTVTIVEDMLPILKILLERKISGTYNIANKGTISPYEIAILLKERVNPKLKIYKTTLEEVNKNLVSKRVTTTLNTDLLETVGYRLPDVHDSIVAILDQFKSNLDKASGIETLSEVRKDALNKYTIIQKNPSTFFKVN